VRDREHVPDPLDALGRMLVDIADKDTDFAPLRAEFWLYAVRNPELRGSMAARLRAPRRPVTELVTQALAGRTARHRRRP
jgi:hypothetical protein